MKKNFKNFDVQPITVFEMEGVFLMTLFPSIFKGFTAVLCGRDRHNANQIRVIHDCMICKGYGHENCPYVQEGMKYYMAYENQKFPSYVIMQRNVVPDPRWHQFTKEQMAELIKKVKDDVEPIAEHIGSGSK